MTDALRPFGQVVLAIRWGTTAISIVLASAELRDGDPAVTASCLLLVAYSAFRTRRPLRFDRPLPGMVRIVAEVTATAVAVALTGAWDSPLVFSLLTAVAVAGFAGGFGVAVRLALAAVVAVTLAWEIDGGLAGDRWRTSAQWGGEILLVALVAGFARRVLGEADERRDQALDRLGRLNDANVLLFQLHQVAQTLPASLDLDDALDTTLAQLRELFDATSVAVLLHDDEADVWHTVRRHGGPAARTYAGAELPAPLARSHRLRSAAREDDLVAHGGPGLDPAARSGLYAALEARGATIGLLAVEHAEAERFGDRDVELLAGFVDPAALAVDNARWFERLRTVGAAEERTRIAKQLHDRIGQSLAYVAFELDRLTKQAGADPLGPALDHLRTDVRTVIGELRDTLYDLRTEVTAAEGLEVVLPRFLDRVAERSTLRITCTVRPGPRLPLLQEREVWRLTQELVALLERQGRPSAVAVTWAVEHGAGALSIEVGPLTPGDRPATVTSPDLSALRERAGGAGAALALEDTDGGGVRVRCSITEQVGGAATGERR